MTATSHTILFTQIAATSVANVQQTQCNWVLFGLDLSGRVWKRTDQHEWERVEHPALLTGEPCHAACGEARCALPKGHDGMHDDGGDPELLTDEDVSK